MLREEEMVYTQSHAQHLLLSLVVAAIAERIHTPWTAVCAFGAAIVFAVLMLKEAKVI